MKKVLVFHVITGNDLAADFYCECPSETFKASPISHLMRTRNTLYGYNDDHFFNEVNKEPRVFTCKCGRQYQYRWTYEGVELELKTV